MNCIAFFDKFGAPYKPKLKNSKQNYKTVFGGVISIIIYLLIFAYFAYKIWQYASNSLIPTQSIAYEYAESLSMVANGDLIKFQVLNTSINPFNKTHQILVPYMTIQQRTQTPPTTYDNQFIYNNNEIDFTTQVYTPKNLSLSVGNTEFPINIQFGLKICDTESDGNCADEPTIDEFFSQLILLRTSVLTSQYNSFSKSISSMIRNNDFIIDKSVLFFQRIILETQLLHVDDGFLLASSKEDWLFCDYSIQTQSTNKMNNKNIFVTEVSISQVVQQKSVQYIKISAVLADVGSIFSTLMMISIIVQFLNQFWMEKEIISDIIGIYYPEFLELKFRRHFYFGSIKEVKYNDRIVNLESFKKFYNQAEKIAKNKLQVTSTIYQISKLQFSIEQILSREAINQTHTQGIQLNLLYQKNTQSREKLFSLPDKQTFLNEEQQNKIQLIFKDEDFSLLDQQHYNLPLNNARQPCKNNPVEQQKEIAVEMQDIKQ